MTDRTEDEPVHPFQALHSPLWEGRAVLDVGLPAYRQVVELQVQSTLRFRGGRHDRDGLGDHLEPYIIAVHYPYLVLHGTVLPSPSLQVICCAPLCV